MNAVIQRAISEYRHARRRRNQASRDANLQEVCTCIEELQTLARKLKRWIKAGSVTYDAVQKAIGPDTGETVTEGVAALKSSILSLCWYYENAYIAYEDVVSFYKQPQNGAERRCDVLTALGELRQEGKITVKRFADGLHAVRPKGGETS